MAKQAKETISASNTTAGPVEVSKGEILVYTVDYTSGNITLQYSVTGDTGSFVAVEDAYTADTTKRADSPGHYQIVGDTSPSAVVHMVAR